MDEVIVSLIQTVGLPISLIVYYLFVERPRQEARDADNNKRYDTLIDKLVTGQKECAEKMENALEEHNEYIKRLIKIFDNKKTVL